MAATFQTSPQLVPAKKAAAELGIPYTSLRQLAFNGDLPVVRLGRAWYFKRIDLSNFVERRTERLSVVA
jgi:excisionase family DNA binding protein